MSSKAVTFLLVGISSIVGSKAFASSGRFKNIPTEGVAQLTVKLQPNVSYEFALVDQTDGAAILDVFNFPTSGTLVAEATGGPEPIPFAARYTAFASGGVRYFGIIVRGQPGSVARSDQLRITGFTGTGQDAVIVGQKFVDISYQNTPGALFTMSGGLQTGTHILTVEQPGGPEDTGLLVFTGGVPLYFDDDDGVGAMSFIHLANNGCPEGDCAIMITRRMNLTVAPDVAGRLASSRPPDPKGLIPLAGNATLIIDEDIHRGRDQDFDGLGNALEGVIGTNFNSIDTDGDGIRDDFEVIGRDDPSKLTNLTKFPLYGADPTKRDIFIEADWIPGCADTDPNCTAAVKDSKKPNLAVVQPLVRNPGSGVPQFFAPDLAIHIDIGSNTVGSGDEFLAGDWGGAERLPDNVIAFSATNPPVEKTARGHCEGFSGARQGTFHHVNFGSGAQSSGFCSIVPTSSAGTVMHEIGHHFSLNHGGSTSSGNINCKPHYRSVMSYIYQDGSTFKSYSRFDFAAVTLDPSQLSERLGLGTSSSPVLDDIERLFLRTVDRGNGGIDWDLDGNINQTVGQSHPGPLVFGTSDCDFGVQRANSTFAAARRPALLGVGNTGVRMVALGNNNLISASGDLSRCGSTAGLDACTHWSAAGSLLYQNVALGDIAPAIAGDLIIYADPQHNLKYLRNAGGRWTSGALGGPIVSGDVMAVEVGNLIRVYAPAGGWLRVWDWDKTKAKWISAGVIQTWSTGGNVGSNIGIGLTKGFAQDQPGETLFAAIPVANGSGLPIEFARLQTTFVTRSFNFGFFQITLVLPVESWEKFPAEVWGAGQPMTSFPKPALAYVPFDPATPSVGRFYLAWTQRQAGLTSSFEARPMITFTRGNRFPLTSPSPGNPLDLRFLTNQLLRNEWTIINSGVALTTIGGRVRGAMEEVPGKITFLPSADGVFRANLKDSDDYTTVFRNMGCALQGSCGGI